MCTDDLYDLQTEHREQNNCVHQCVLEMPRQDYEIYSAPPEAVSFKTTCMAERALSQWGCTWCPQWTGRPACVRGPLPWQRPEGYWADQAAQQPAALACLAVQRW